MRIYLFFCFVLLATQPMLGQNMHLSHYSTANGLPSDQVRHVALDSLGFAWIATDAGLIRFDGTNFEGFSQYVPSQYGKYLMPTPEGLLFSHDAGISLVQPQLDTTGISLFQEASIDPEAGLLYYPNRIFRRSNGDVLVGQPGGQVHRISKGALQLLIPRSGEAVKQDVELFFAEVAGQLWVAHSDGALYVYDEQTKQLGLQASFPGIFDLKSAGEQLWIASDRIFGIQLRADGTEILREESYPAPGEVTALVLDREANIYLGIRDSGLHYLDRTLGESPECIRVFGNNDPHSLNELPFRNIHSLVMDAGGKLWVCASEGLGILQKRFFESIGSIPNANATAISAADNGNIFVNFGDLYRIEKTNYGYRGEQLPTASLGTITALTTRGDRLWTGTSTGKLFELTQNGGKIREINLEARGEGIFYLAGDSQKRLWVAQAPRDQPIVGIACILPDGTFKNYGVEQGIENRIICLRETQKGRIYASGIGKDSYLYRYAPETDRFVNLSVPFDFYVGPNFQVHDFAVDQKGVIWMATTDGLFRHDMDRIRKVDLGAQYSDLEAKGVTHTADGSIWVAFNTDGVLRYKEGNTVVMKEESGLPSKVMTYRCIQKDGDDRLWIGTAEGIVYSLDPSPQPGKSGKPWILSTGVDGAEVPSEAPELYAEQQLQISYKTPAFHGYRTFYQYKINSDPWSVPTTETTLALAGLPPGDHTLSLRAKKEGAYFWSDPRNLTLTVAQHWFKSNTFLWLMGIVLFVTTALVFRTQRRRFKLDLNTLSQGLEAKEDEVSKQEADLVKVRKEMHLKIRERKANLLVLEIMHRLLSKIGPDTKWERVLESISLDIFKLPGIVAFEIGVHRGKHIEFEGYSEIIRGFTASRVPNDPATSLAAYCMGNAKAYIFNRLQEEAKAILHKKDARIEGYKAAISVPFYIENRNAIFTVYANKEDLFDEYTRRTFQIFATYLEQIV